MLLWQEEYIYIILMQFFSPICFSATIYREMNRDSVNEWYGYSKGVDANKYKLGVSSDKLYKAPINTLVS